MNGIAIRPSLIDEFIFWLASILNVFNDSAEDRGDDFTGDADDGAAEGGETDEGDPGDGDGDDDKDGEGGDGDGDGEDEVKDHLIPKSRYDYQANRARTAESENEKLRQELEGLKSGAASKDAGTPSLDDQISDLDKQIEQARADNDIDKVVSLNADLRNLEREQYTQIANNESTSAGRAPREQIKLDAVIDDLEEQYPQLNEEAKEYDQDLVNEILDLQEGFVASGKYTPSKAMQRAAALLLPNPTEVDKGKGEKRKTDVNKNLDAAKDIPPSSSDKGENSDKGGDVTDPSQIDNMTEKEFDALPEETKKRLRGDTF